MKLNILILFLVVLISCQNNNKRPIENYLSEVFEINENGEIVTFSLKVFLKKIETRENDSTLYNLGGMTRISGYIIDNDNDDIVLFGEKEKDNKALSTANFIIALKNSFHKYDSINNRISYYEYPGCSIDPDPNIINKLNNISELINTSTSNNQIDNLIDKWFSICESPQNVRVLGIPFDSDFARILVKADYDMKSLVDGSDTLHLSGYNSLAQMYITEIKQYLNGNSNKLPSISGLNRFWFRSSDIKYQNSTNIVLLKKCNVILSTEQEELSSTKQITPSGKRDLIAERYARDFTTHYKMISGIRPIYRQLEDLFRIFAVTQAIEFNKKKINFDINGLLKLDISSDFLLEKELPGKPNLNKVKNDNSIFWLPTCGGVNIDIKPDRDNFESNRKLAAVSNRLLQSRKNLNQLSSIIPVKSEGNKNISQKPEFLEILGFDEKRPNQKLMISLGRKNVEISFDDLSNFIVGNLNDIPELKELIQNSDTEKIIIYRNEILRTDKIDIDIIQFYQALQKNFPDIEFYCDDNKRLAISNINSIPKIKVKNDLGFYLIDSKFVEHEIISDLNEHIIEAEFVLQKDFNILMPNSNIVIITGHKEEEYYSLLNELGQKGGLENKAVLAFACYDKALINEYSALITNFGAKEFVYIPSVIRVKYMDLIVREMIKIINSSSELNITPHQLLKQSIINVMNNYEVEDDFKEYANFIKQISFMNHTNIKLKA